jgi:hypothetical protein
MGTVCPGSVALRTIIILSPPRPVRTVVSSPSIWENRGAFPESMKYSGLVIWIIVTVTGFNLTLR